MSKYYVIEVWGDVDPILHGSFGTKEARLSKAREMRAGDPQMENSLYRLDVDFELGTVEVSSFSGQELDE